MSCIKGSKLSIEHKANIAKSHFGKKRKPFSNEWKENIRNSMKGKKHSSETIKKITLAHTGRIFSKEHKRKISEYRTGKKASKETKKKMSESWYYEKIITPERNKKISKSLSGKNHPQWKGGISPLGVIIRNLKESKDWKMAVFQRDNFTCQICFQKGGNIEAHHKKAFSIIFKEFLQMYSQFSPIEDKETLIKLAINYYEFWDIKIGMTLCENCHKSVLITRNSDVNC